MKVVLHDRPTCRGITDLILNICGRFRVDDDRTADLRRGRISLVRL